MAVPRDEKNVLNIKKPRKMTSSSRGCEKLAKKLINLSMMCRQRCEMKKGYPARVAFFEFFAAPPAGYT